MNLTFDQPYHEFFETFTRFENAPTWTLGNGDFESGLGEFQISSVSPDGIKLVRKKQSNQGFNTILVHAYQGQEKLADLAKRHRIEDFNRVSPELVPIEVKQTYRNYGVVLLQTVVLLLNIRDRELRRAIYNCIDINKFRQALSPGQSIFKNIKTILPIGVPGAVEGVPDQKCRVDKLAGRRIASVKFWNWKDNNRDVLRDFWADFTRSTGIPIAYSDITPERLFAIAKRQERDHELITIGLSATEFHYKDFYQYLVHPHHTLFSVSAVDMSADLAKLDARPTKEELAFGISRIDTVLADEALALPLFQQVREFYYPSNLKGFNFGSNFLEHPIVSEISN
ncbi:MAG: hypothetical protein HC902_14970 [Calothrix sp. SM1_5_4]|nr:hypothetical protein [Calothrix sp. SM1_5_4]